MKEAIVENPPVVRVNKSTMDVEVVIRNEKVAMKAIRVDYGGKVNIKTGEITEIVIYSGVVEIAKDTNSLRDEYIVITVEEKDGKYAIKTIKSWETKFGEFIVQYIFDRIQEFKPKIIISEGWLCSKDIINFEGHAELNPPHWFKCGAIY